MRHERITKAEVLAAIRYSGYSDTSQVHFVLLETDGRMSVIPKANEEDRKYEALGTVETFFAHPKPEKKLINEKVQEIERCFYKKTHKDIK